MDMSKHYRALKVKDLQMMHIWWHSYITSANLNGWPGYNHSHSKSQTQKPKLRPTSAATRHIKNTERTERSRIASINVRNYNITINRRTFTQFLWRTSDSMLLEIIGDNENCKSNSNEKVFAAQTVRPNELSHYGHLLITQRFDGKHCKYMMTDDIWRF